MLRQFGLPRDQIGPRRTLIFGALAKRCCRREIVFLGIFADCAIGRKGRSQAGHTFAHAGNPAAWNSMLIAGVERWDNLSFEQCIETFSFSCVPRRVIPMFAPISDRPAYFGGIRLCPPAIEFR